MERLYYLRSGEDADTFNCVELELTTEDITNLKQLVASGDLPDSEGGFFFGHQFQDEAVAEYREQDLEFCKWAKAIL